MSYEPVHHGEGRLRASHESLRATNSMDLAKTPAQSPITPVSRFSPKRTRQGISVTAGIAMMLFGYEQGVFGGIIIGNRFEEFFDHPSASTTGFVTSIYDLGCLAGALLTLVIGQKLGRKRMLILSTIVMTTGIIIQTAAGSMQALIWGRLIAGIGNGGNTATAPVWHVETTSAEAKGKAVAKEMTVNVLGFAVSNILTLAFSHAETDAQWRFPLGIQLIFCIAILGLVPMFPESPRWLLSRKREAEAKTALAQLNDKDVEAEFQDIKNSVRQEMAAQTSWKQLFTGGTPTRRVLLGMLLQVCQQASGINAICYYLPFALHESVGLAEDPSRALAAAISVLYMVVTGCSVFIIERAGRRRLLMWTAGAMAAALVGIAISSEIEQNGGSQFVTGVVATVFISLFLFSFGLGWISVPWSYPSEINSLSLRTKGAALATATDWFCNWVVVATTPPGLAALKWGLYIIYALLNALFIPIVYYFVVETAGKSLEEMDEWFARYPAWRVDGIAENVPGSLRSKERRFSADEEQDESRGLVKSTTTLDGGEDRFYDGDAHAMEETDFAIGANSDSEEGDDVGHTGSSR